MIMVSQSKYQMSIQNQKLKNGSMKVRLSVYNVEKIEERESKNTIEFLSNAQHIEEL